MTRTQTNSSLGFCSFCGKMLNIPPVSWQIYEGVGRLGFCSPDCEENYEEDIFERI